jgi:hypothetical protein
VQFSGLDILRKTLLVITLVAISLIAGLVTASDLRILNLPLNQNHLQPKVEVFCRTGTYLANHHCVTSCPTGYSPVTWAADESSVCMSPDNRPVSIYDLADFHVSGDNGRTVFLIVVNVPLIKVSITQEILNGQIWGGYLPVSQSVLASLSEDTTVPNVTTEVATVGDMAGMLSILRFDIDSLSGNITFAYPLCCRVQATIVHVGDDVGINCEGWSEVLQRIDLAGPVAVFTRTTGLVHAGCPICLSGDTLIDTPNGQVNVKKLVLGMVVWTVDKSGKRVQGVIQELRRSAVPLTDEIVHIVLADGRQLYASANHPTTDKRTMGELRPGVALDGSIVTVTEFVPYGQGYTYDLLPAGGTGYYWANGILIGSTLAS